MNIIETMLLAERWVAPMNYGRTLRRIPNAVSDELLQAGSKSSMDVVHGFCDGGEIIAPELRA
jgi:hypothetical protein